MADEILYDTMLEALEEQGLVVSTWGEAVAARCPAHEDTRPSFSLSEGEDGKALYVCHKGCEASDIVRALGGHKLFTEYVPEGAVVAQYVYTDEEGLPLIRVNRTDPKGFFQERMEAGRWVSGIKGSRKTLYRLPSVIEAVEQRRTVYIVEGEKDADAIVDHGGVATSAVGGAGRWREEYTPFLRGAHVIVIPDQDEPGRKYAAQVRDALLSVAASVEIRLPATGKDVSDHFAAGLRLEDLKEEDFFEELGSIDWDNFEVEEEEWLLKPYIPVAGRVLVYGKTGSLKSLFVMWLAAKLAKDGKRVAYFSLEMRPSQSVARLRKLDVPKKNFTLLTKLKLEDREHVRLAAEALKGYDLIVIDSWNAAIKKSHYDQEIADLDTVVFQPFIDATGATLLLIDNTGHDVITDKGIVRMDRARGSSAKADKMDITLWMDRPFEDDNYMTELHVKKMRYDFPIPAPVRLSTPSDDIDFWMVNDKNMRTSPFWGGTWNVGATRALDETAVSDTALPGQDDPPTPAAPSIVEEGAVSDQGETTPGSPSEPSGVVNPSSMTIEEQLAFARMMDSLGGEKVNDSE